MEIEEPQPWVQAAQPSGPVTSRHNPAVKLIRSLRQRKARDESQLFFVEGYQLVAQAVHLRAEVETFVFAPELVRSPFAREFVRRLEAADAPILRVAPDVFDDLVRKESARGIAAVVRQRWRSLADVGPGAELCWVALEETQYPGNLGTILRTLDAVGGAGAILLGSTADPYDPAAVNASTGAVFSQQLVRASWEEFSNWQARHGCAVVGTSPAAAVDYRAATYPRPLVLFLGNERRGLPPEHQACCDLTVRIPMAGRCDSLNLSIAAGIVLYEIYSQYHAASQVVPMEQALGPRAPSVSEGGG